MTEARKTLTLRDEGTRPAAPAIRGRGWGISSSRLDRVHDFARDMRRNPTEPEALLWARLKEQKLGGFKFRRHQVVGSAIIDFACPARWVAVEVDGDAHDVPGDIALRDKKLTDVGIRVVRFTSEQVMQDIDAVLKTLLAELQKPFDRKRAAARPRSDAPSESEGHKTPRRDAR